MVNGAMQVLVVQEFKMSENWNIRINDNQAIPNVSPKFIFPMVIEEIHDLKFWSENSLIILLRLGLKRLGNNESITL